MKPEYDRLKAQLEKAAESSTLNFNKKRTINAEVKQFKEQQNEADKYDRLKLKWAKLVQIQHLWKLYHLERELEQLRDGIEQDREATSQFTNRQKELQEELRGAKKVYAKVNKLVLVNEKRCKDKERERLDLVYIYYT